MVWQTKQIKFNKRNMVSNGYGENRRKRQFLIPVNKGGGETSMSHSSQNGEGAKEEERNKRI